MLGHRTRAPISSHSHLSCRRGATACLPPRLHHHLALATLRQRRGLVWTRPATPPPVRNLLQTRSLEFSYSGAVPGCRRFRAGRLIANDTPFRRTAVHRGLEEIVSRLRGLGAAALERTRPRRSESERKEGGGGRVDDRLAASGLNEKRETGAGFAEKNENTRDKLCRLTRTVTCASTSVPCALRDGGSLRDELHGFKHHGSASLFSPGATRRSGRI